MIQNLPKKSNLFLPLNVINSGYSLTDTKGVLELSSPILVFHILPHLFVSWLLKGRVCSSGLEITEKITFLS